MLITLWTLQLPNFLAHISFTLRAPYSRQQRHFSWCFRRRAKAELSTLPFYLFARSPRPGRPLEARSVESNDLPEFRGVAIWAHACRLEAKRGMLSEAAKENAHVPHVNGSATYMFPWDYHSMLRRLGILFNRKNQLLTVCTSGKISWMGYMSISVFPPAVMFTGHEHNSYERQR